MPKGERPAAPDTCTIVAAGHKPVIAISEHCRKADCTYRATGRSLSSVLRSLGAHVVYKHKPEEGIAYG